MLRMAMGLVLLPMMAFAADLQPQNEWKNCNTDADCVTIKGICRPAAVNMNYQSAAERYYAQEAEKTTCPQEFWHPAAPVPRCRLNACELVQKDAK